jgi:glycosyltransferase involved in cell wall biosynthesis
MSKIALACNSPWQAGGQGNFLNRAAYGLSSLGELTVYCAGNPSHSNDLNEVMSLKGMGFSWHSRQLLKTPILRRNRDLATLWSDEYFDQQVKQDLINLKSTNINQESPMDSPHWFVGVAGQSATTMAWLKKNHHDAMVWLYCLNAYLPFMQAQILQELAVLQDPSKAAMHPKMLARFTQECNLADYIVVNAEFAKQTFVDAGVNHEKIGVIHPIVDCERFCPSPRIQDDQFRVLYVGTIDPRKGVHYLIPAFVQAAIPDSELLLVGGYATRATRQLTLNALEQYANIKNEVWDFRQIDPRQIFGRCDVLVMPSVEDGFGVVALEGMACGLPVIVTSYCGAADLIEDGVNGFIVPPRNITAITERLQYLANHPAARERMGQLARATALQQNQSRYNQDLHNLYEGFCRH